MAIQLPSLPYEMNALEPYISKNTLEFHYGKHHNAYVTNLNKLIESTPLAGKSLEEIITSCANDPSQIGIFNNAAQVWNHSFYWKCMKPNGGGHPSASLQSALEKSFNGYEQFLVKFKEAALTQFGSGWAWLVKDASGSLSILKTANASLPMVEGKTALLTIDVWEHAYYLDYQNRRPDYVATFLDKLINWDFVEAQFQNS